MQATAIFQTQHAPRHLARLCEHFSTKVDATFSDTLGHVAFPFGTCELTAEETQLTLLVSADDAVQLSQVMDVTTRHLERFAFRENPQIEWDVAIAAPDATTRRDP